MVSIIDGIYMFYEWFILSRRTNPVLIVLSMDGFRADYLLRNMTPNLKKLSDCGVHSPYMRAMFPTKTFPNHYTIATVSCC